MLLGDIDNLYLTIPCYKDNNIVITTSDYKIKNKVFKNKIDVLIKLKGTINEVNCNIDLENPNNIKDIKKKTKIKLNEYLKKAINKAKNNKIDIFGYGNLIYKKYPKYYYKIKDWDTYFKDLNININIDFNLKSRGSTEYTIGGLYEQKR